MVEGPQLLIIRLSLSSHSNQTPRAKIMCIRLLLRCRLYSGDLSYQTGDPTTIGDRLKETPYYVSWPWFALFWRRLRRILRSNIICTRSDIGKPQNGWNGNISISHLPQTLSIHYSSPGFFPASARAQLPNVSSPEFDPLTLSIPLQRGASNITYARIWPIVEHIKETFLPDYIVVQCGVDTLAGDPCSTFNWSLGNCEGSLGWCIQRILMDWPGKKLLLGGGERFMTVTCILVDILTFKAVTTHRTLLEPGLTLLQLL